MLPSYTTNYIKIYFWQGVSLVLNFLSMFIVIPFLTSIPSIYGIYTVSISFSIFLSYADLGFLSAGQKYAAEHYSRGEIAQEIKIVGFTSFILLIVLLVFSFSFFFLGLNPNIIFKEIKQNEEASIASSLFIILAIFTPITLLQRISQIIFGIRLEDYILHRINIVASFFKILSVLYFFKAGKYDIVGYFLFCQVSNLIAVLFILQTAIKRFGYDFKNLISSIRFSRTIFFKTKNLAISSLFMTITWILYYELDPATIGKFIGSKEVAIYAIGLTVLSFFRSILGILFSPFNARFNHFVGISDHGGLRSFYFDVIKIFAPLIIFPLIIVWLLAKPIVLSWVGHNYYNSIEIVKFLTLCNIFAFITYPTGLLLMAQERIKEIYFVNTLLPVIYWSGIIICYPFLGLKSYAIFKFIAFFSSAILYYYIMLKFVRINFLQSIQNIFAPLLLPLIILITSTLFVRNILPCEKSSINLLFVGATAFTISFVSYLILYLTNSQIRLYFSKILNFKSFS